MPCVSPFLIAINSASRLQFLRHPSGIPPVVIKTRGIVAQSPSFFCHTYVSSYSCVSLPNLLGDEILIRFCVWMRNPAIKKQNFVFPKTTCMNIQPRALADIFAPGFRVSPLISCIEPVQSQRHNCIHKYSRVRLPDLVQFIVALNNQASSFTYHCMIYIHLHTSADYH